MSIRTLHAFLVVLAFQSIAAPSAMGLTGRPCPGPLFDNPEYPVGEALFWVATGDLDGDGDLDLAVANRGNCCPFPPGTVSVDDARLRMLVIDVEPNKLVHREPPVQVGHGAFKRDPESYSLPRGSGFIVSAG